jgi:hypothetical protein
MSSKRIFLQQRSHKHNLREFSSEIDDTNEQHDTIEPLQSLMSEEQTHRTRRRTSLPILDIKFLHTLSNQIDTESNESVNGAENVCECE